MSRGFAVQAGKLRHRVQLQCVTRTRSATGSSVITYTDGPKSWASIVQAKGQELERLKQSSPNSSFLIRLRTVDGLVEGNRITYKNKIFDIDDVNDIDLRGKITELACTEVKGTHGGDGQGVA